jgi:hypothetical protein
MNFLGNENKRVSKKNGVFWDVMPPGCCKNRRFELTGATRRNIPEDAILHSHRCENLKSYRKIK